MRAYVRVQNKMNERPFFCKSVKRKEVSEQCMYDLKSKLNFTPMLSASDKYKTTKLRKPLNPVHPKIPVMIPPMMHKNDLDCINSNTQQIKVYVH